MKVARFEFSLFGINTYVVYDPVSKECAIVDPGMSSQQERDAIVRFIERNDLKVTHLINTHLHVDHAAGDHFIISRYGVKPEAHREDGILGERMRQQASIVLYDQKDGFMIAGDVLFQGSIGRTDLPGGSHKDLVEGIKNKLMPLPDSTVVLPGHGPETTIGEEKRSNPFLR